MMKNFNPNYFAKVNRDLLLLIIIIILLVYSFCFYSRFSGRLTAKLN